MSDFICRAVLRDRVERGQNVHRIAAQSPGIHHHQMAQQRQTLTDFQHLGELFLILAHDHAGIRHLQQVFDLGRGGGRIDADGHRAQHACAKLGENPLLAVLADDGHMALFRQSQCCQTEREVPRMTLVVTP